MSNGWMWAAIELGVLIVGLVVVLFLVALGIAKIMNR